MPTQPLPKSNVGGMVFSALVGLLGIGIVTGSFWNHSRTEDWLSGQKSQTVTIDPNDVDPKNEGRLVHVMGPVTSQPHEHYDPALDIRGQGWAMVRQTLEYGYAGGDGGGGDGWYSRREPSVLGDAPEASQDRFRTAVWVPASVQMGAFTLDDSLVRSYLRQKFPHTWNAAATVPHSQRTARDDIRLHLENAAWNVAPFRELKFAKSTDGAPQYGDKRVLFRVFTTDAEPVTLLCQQSGNRLEPLRRDQGPPFFQLILGQATRDEAYASAFQVARRDRLISGGLGAVLVLAAVGTCVRMRRARADF